ncbi:hypothetical protein [Salinirubrum litoreum]|uniref:Uncharacterized protein n=1 Tax=Salinirubrum litoreum TaxID=1126234 RepID=A0ABD5RBV5_9EURY|nr:hypothetical protein [Salinirubrum litoreum]
MTYSRRTVLAGIGMAALAGCTGEGVSPAGSSSGGSGSNEIAATVEGETIQIEVLPDTVESVSVIDPEGRLWTERPVPAGVTRVDVGLDERYTPGEFRIVGASGGATVAETRLEIMPDLRIVEFDVGRNQPERMPEGLGSVRDIESLVSVENRGTGPEYVRRLLFNGDVPYPTTRIESASDRTTGIFGETEPVLIASGETITLFSSTIPFSLAASRTIDCESEFSGTAIVSLIPSVGAESLTTEFPVLYRPSTDADECDVTIEVG